MAVGGGIAKKGGAERRWQTQGQPGGVPPLKSSAPCGGDGLARIALNCSSAPWDHKGF